MKRCGGWYMGGAIICLIILTLGCTYVQRGAAVGAAGGAAVGGVLGATRGILNAGEGAAVGAAAGGLAGALIGDQLEEKKVKELSADIDNLKSQLAAKDQLIEQKDNELKQVLDELADKDKQLNDQAAQLAQLQQANEEKLKNLKTLEDKLKDLEVQLQQTPKGLELTILDKVLFASGSDELTSKGQQILDQVAEIIKQHFPTKEIMVEGHTDNVPIKYSGWKSNWELGAARALAVLHYLIDKHGFNPAKMSAVTYSFYRPVADNSTPEGRQQNRRSVIVILPQVEKNYLPYAAQ